LGIAHLVLTGRKAPDAQATKAIEAMRAAGARVTVAQCDITSREALQKALDAIPAELPLRGIVHVAGVKDDALLKDQNETKFAKVLAPKVQGTWLLHELTAELHIEVFCMYSSLTALAGLAGVANYAVGNIFLDGMAAYRRSIGKEALAIDWGAWTNAGMLAERSLEDLQREMRSRGIGLIEEKPGMELFGYAATHQLLEPTLIVAPILLNDTAPFELPNGEIAPLYREVLGHAAKASGEVQEKAINLRAILAKAPQEERKAILTEAIQKQVAAVVKRTDHTEIDPEDDIFSFGIDSLMASELIGKLSKALRQQLSPTILFDHRTIASLSEFLLDVALELTEEDGAEADETPARTPQEGAPAQPAQIASPPPTPATSNGNGHPVESPVVKADWEMVIRTTLTRELAARGMNESLIEESWMLRRSVKKLIKLLEKKA
jgi:acyl carrier protein